MKRLSHIFIMVLMALMPTMAQAHDDMDLAISKFVSTQNDDKIIGVDKFASLDSLNGKHAYDYVYYSFTLKGRTRSDLNPVVDAFRKAQPEAYSLLVKSVNSISDRRMCVSMDGLTNCIVFGVNKNMNYQVLAIHDDVNPLYRYVYALTYGPAGKNSIKGEIYRIYTRDPNVKESKAQVQRSSGRLSSNQTFLIIDDKGNVTLNGDTLLDGASRESLRQLDALGDSLDKMKKQLDAMGDRMGALANEPVKNKPQMKSLVREMKQLNAKMNQLSSELQQKTKDVANSYRMRFGCNLDNNNDEDFKKFNNQFGSFHNLYRSGPEKHKDGTYMAGLANNIYSLSERSKALSDKPDLKAVWKSSLEHLIKLESDTYRKSLLEAALKNVGR